MTNVQNYLGTFPRDCSSQQLYIEQLKQYLRSLEDEVTSSQNLNIFVCQSTEPTQSDWELAWIGQTGKILPIPPSADLYWLSQDCSTSLGVYGTIEGSSVVQSRIGNKPSGTSLILYSLYPLFTTFSDSIGSVEYFGTTFNVPIKSTLVMSCQTWGQIFFGPSGPYAIDFVLDGNRVGVTQYGIDPGDGISQMFDNSPVNTPGNLGAVAVVPNVPAGEHTFAVVGGIINSGISGAYKINAASVLVRGYAE